jgi:DNA (cytosine-5)-methyltransferase 1
MKLRLLDLFSGIGGFSLGLERSGAFQAVAFCEIDPYCRRVLAKHWPGVKRYIDVRTLTADTLSGDGIAVDAICGGFPCQDISYAGAGAGMEGARSGLWGEYARLIGEIRPRYAIVENVPALLTRGLERVVGDLAEIGYDSEWHCIPASAVGAPHRRDRIWIVGHPERLGCHGKHRRGAEAESADGYMEMETRALADTECGRLEGGHVQRAGSATIIPAAFGRHRGGDEFGSSWWSEPDVGRVAHGVPDRVDRLKALGNAVVPQIPELIGRCLSRAG